MVWLVRVHHSIDTRCGEHWLEQILLRKPHQLHIHVVSHGLIPVHAVPFSLSAKRFIWLLGQSLVFLLWDRASLSVSPHPPCHPAVHSAGTLGNSCIWAGKNRARNKEERRRVSTCGNSTFLKSVFCQSSIIVISLYLGNYDGNCISWFTDSSKFGNEWIISH